MAMPHHKDIVQVAQHPSSGWVFIMEHVDMGGLNRHQAILGKQLARSKECSVLHIFLTSSITRLTPYTGRKKILNVRMRDVT